jgi:hypothetical protein
VDKRANDRRDNKEPSSSVTTVFRRDSRDQKSVRRVDFDFMVLGLDT